MGQYSTMADPVEIYRFRSAKALLNGYNELSRQTLYLALPEQLNDPAEDTYNVVWEGDDIIWPNFLGYYLRCVASSMICQDKAGRSAIHGDEGASWLIPPDYQYQYWTKQWS